MPPHSPSLPDAALISAGPFLMGDDAGRDDERPAHCVWLAAFWIARLPVTNADYDRFVAATSAEPARCRGDARFSDPQQPVVAVSWFEAVAYCDWLASATGRAVRLPSEAEWEKAARGGSACGAYPWGDDPTGWSADPALGQRRQAAPNPVGLSRPNGYGLHDMGYNVHEWCSDWYDPAYYQSAPEHNPRGPSEGRRRASRGGAWRHQVQANRTAARSSLDPTFRYNDYGFRVVWDAGR